MASHPLRTMMLCFGGLDEVPALVHDDTPCRSASGPDE